MTARIFVGVSVAEPAASTLETAAAARLYERHSSRVFGYCLGMLRSREDAEDAAQTTFMQAFRALQRGVVPTFETAWLLTIAKNVCLARHRAGSRRKAVEFARDPHDLAEIAAGAEAPNGVLMGLQDALARLPEMQRRAFLLREWQGRTYVEIAAELGVTVSAVEALIFRARRALARDLDGDAKRRGHAFDLASLAGALKSFLGGGAAVKVAVGAAAVVSAGAVVGGTLQRSEAPAPARERQSPLATAEASGAGSSRPSPSVRSDRAAGAQVAPNSSRKSAPSTPAAPPGSATPSAPAGSSPQPGPGPGQPAAGAQPQSPVPDAPAVPGVPDPPAVSPPPVELPPLPIDQLPVEVPQVPELPGVPDVVPELPAVPDVPDLPGVPELPKLP